MSNVSVYVQNFSINNDITDLNALQASSASFCTCIGHIFASHCTLESAQEFPNSEVVVEISPSRLSLSFLGLLSKYPHNPSTLPV